MNEPGTTQSSPVAIEEVLRDELARGDIVLDTIGPILGHLLANHDHSLFSDEIVSRVRGMLTDLARQLLVAEAEASEAADPRGYAEQNAPALAEALVGSPALLEHAHALSLEWQLAARLEARNAVDPVLSPLLQALIASDEAATASAAMAALAAQARFTQAQRRMELPLAELPADLFHAALLALRGFANAGEGESAGEARLRREYDEGASRLGLLARLVTAMGAGARAALSISHAGVALFLTALAAASNQRRDVAVISTNERQLTRFALALRATGLKPKEVEEQFLYVHPEVALPTGFDGLRADRASVMLSAGRCGPGS
ncbi:MAG: hypothetical protein ACTHKM_06210 [Tsuneonella sp.]